MKPAEIYQQLKEVNGETTMNDRKRREMLFGGIVLLHDNVRLHTAAVNSKIAGSMRMKNVCSSTLKS